MHYCFLIEFDDAYFIKSLVISASSLEVAIDKLTTVLGESVFQLIVSVSQVS